MATWPDILMRLSFDENLDAADTAWMLDEVFNGRATDGQLGAFLMGMQTKGATAAEVNGMVETMLAHAAPLSIPGRSVDIVGTGGDKANTVNISTMAALVIAGAGLRVVKHGSRASSSTTGSSDVLAALGVNLDLEPQRVAEVVEEVGITSATPSSSTQPCALQARCERNWASRRSSTCLARSRTPRSPP